MKFGVTLLLAAVVAAAGVAPIEGVHAGPDRIKGTFKGKSRIKRPGDTFKATGRLIIRRYQVGRHEYLKPKIQGLPLDWCKSLRRDCGKPAAIEFCSRNGYMTVPSFEKGSSVNKTRTITGQICTDPPISPCHTFSYITCQTFGFIFKWDAPRDKGTIIGASGERLDWCLEWGKNCGKPAADAFCRARGYIHALKYEPWIGVPFSTITIAGARICNSKTAGRCDSFRSITCSYTN